MIKYLGSKRRLVPALSAIANASGARTALDLFTGTTRVAQAFKSCGIEVTAVDSARYAAAFARCYIETDPADIDLRELARVLAGLNALAPQPGYVTEVFSVQSALPTAAQRGTRGRHSRCHRSRVARSSV